MGFGSQRGNLALGRKKKGVILVLGFAEHKTRLCPRSMCRRQCALQPDLRPLEGVSYAVAQLTCEEAWSQLEHLFVALCKGHMHPFGALPLGFSVCALRVCCYCVHVGMHCTFACRYMRQTQSPMQTTRL